MKPIKAKVLLQKLEDRCIDRHPDDGDFDFILGAAIMTKLLQQQGVITKGQCNYLEIQFTEMAFRVIAKRNEEQELRQKAIQEERQEEEKAAQGKRKQESICPDCGKSTLIQRWYPYQECEILMGGCGHIKPGLEEIVKTITEKQNADRALLERIKAEETA